MQTTDTRSPTALRPQSDVDVTAVSVAKTVATVFGLMMLTATLAFGLGPAAAAVTAFTMIGVLTVGFVCTQPILDRLSAGAH